MMVRSTTFWILVSSLVAVGIAILQPPIPGSCGQTNAGNQFCLGFYRNQFGSRGEAEVIPPVLSVTTEESTRVNFTVYTIAGLLFNGFAIRGQITYVNIPLGLIVFESVPENTAERFKGICIQAEGNRTIVVFGQHEELGSNDAYQALPVFELPPGRPYEYVVASVHGTGSTAGTDSVALVIGTEDDTRVTVIPTLTIGAIEYDYPPAIVVGFFFGLPDSSNTLTIGRYEALYLQFRNGDLTGTRIIANKPISVFSGHECGNIPLTGNPCDHLIEQIPPIDTWGNEVVTVPLRTRIGGDIIKVIAAHSSTTVNITRTDINTGAFTADPSFTLNSGEFREILIDDYSLIQSSRPIGVFQFSRSWEVDGVETSDPFMLYVPPCEQYRNSFAVATAPFNETLEGTLRGGRTAYVNYTNIAIPAVYFDVTQLTINNAIPSATDFTPIRNTDNTTWGYGAQLFLDEGVQVMSHQNPNASFGVTAYGFSLQMSWGYTAGQRLAPVALAVISFDQSGVGANGVLREPESVGTTNIVLVLSKPIDQDATITVRTIDINATAGQDYANTSPQNHQVTFSAGETIQMLRIIINDDNVSEGNETFFVEILTTAEAGAAGVITGCDHTPQLTYEIIDNDAPTVMFENPTYRVIENAGPAQPVLVLSNPSTTNITVQVFTTNGSATGGGVDYSSGPYTVTFLAGETRVPFDVPINDDNIFEGNEDFDLTIDTSSLPAGVTRGDPGIATVTIVDDDPITVTFSQTTYNVDEDDGPAQPVLVLSNPSSTDITVQVRDTENTATNGGVDYDSGIYNVTIPAGQTSVPFDVPINNDTIFEGNEDFNLTIIPNTLPDGVTRGNPDTATVTIRDDDDLTVSFNQITYSVDEDDGPAQPVLDLSNPSSTDITVQVRDTQNTATRGGVDYDSGIYNVVIPAGETSVPFDVPINDDDIYEGNEDFDLTIIRNTLPAGVTRGNPDSATVTIRDDDDLTVSFNQTTYNVDEDDGPAQPVLVLSNPSSTDITVQVRDTENTATNGGVDYDSGIYTVTFPAGETSVPFDVPINDDNILEGNEDFDLTIIRNTLPAGVTRDDPFRATVTIRDDDSVLVRFERDSYTVNEGDGTATIRVVKVGTSEIPVTVTVDTSDITATAGEDYGTEGDPTPPSFTSITIAPDETFVDVEVTIIDDDCDENNERFGADLMIPPSQVGRVTLGTPDQTVVTIVDDDDRTVDFVNAPYTVMEGPGVAANVCLSITPVCDLSAEVTLQTRPRSASPDFDYDSSSVTVRFEPNQSISCVSIDIIDDATFENTEEFELVIVPRDGSGINTDGDGTTIVTINDNDVIDPAGARQVNDTVIGDPLYEVPLNTISMQTFPVTTSLCYEIHGEAGKIFNLVSDGCVQVNAEYSAMDIPENGNIISKIGVAATDTEGDCIRIEVSVDDCVPVVNGNRNTSYNENGVTASLLNGRVTRARISVPNCDNGRFDNLVFWVVCQDIGGQNMIKFQVMRGSNLQPDAHGLVGQFWNVPVSVRNFTGDPLTEDSRITPYIVTVDYPQAPRREFVAELYHRTWDKSLRPCLYAGDGQGGQMFDPTLTPNDPVIAGTYQDYEVSDIFASNFEFNKLLPDRCAK